MSEPCKHFNLDAKVGVARIEDIGRFVAENVKDLRGPAVGMGRRDGRDGGRGVRVGGTHGDAVAFACPLATGFAGPGPAILSGFSGKCRSKNSHD